MKKLLFTAVSALALAGVATAADSTQFGVLPVSSTTTRTLVAVPWAEASTSNSNIAVSNLVLTANLTAGDTLDVLDGTGAKLNEWRLTDHSGVLYWDSVTQVQDNSGSGVGDVSQSPSSNSATIPRGSSVILIRQNPTNDVGVAIPFYVMGQVATTAGSTTIVAGTAEKPCYNMIAPPSTVAQYLNVTDGGHYAAWTGTINENDRIIVPTQYLNVNLAYTNGNWSWSSTTTVTNYYKYVKDNNGKWVEQKTTKDDPECDRERTDTVTEWLKYSTAIPVGTGFWYVSYGGSPTVTWADVPVKQ